VIIKEYTRGFERKDIKSPKVIRKR